MDFDLQWLKNQAKSTPRDPQNDPKCIPKATLLQRMPLELHFLKIWWFFGAKMLSKSRKKWSKNDNEKQWFFRDVFSSILHHFWSQNGLKINLCRSKADFRKTWFHIGKTNVFEVRALRKATFSHLETRPRKNTLKKHYFWVILTSVLTPETHRKAVRNATRFSTLCELPATRRKAPGVTPLGLRI